MCLIVSSTLFVNKINILFQKKKTINLKPNSKETCIDLEEDWFPYRTGLTFCRTDQWYFPVNRRRTWSHIWNLEPPSMRALSVCNIIRIYSKVEDYKIENKTCIDTNMNERKWRQPLLQLHLVTKSCGRWELGLLTSSGAVLSLKKNAAMYDVSIY